MSGLGFKMKKAWTKSLGFTADFVKANIAKTAGDEIRTSCFKATNHLKKPPKPKHVERLCQTLQISPANDLVIATCLESILRSATSWIVALKTMAVFHTLIQEGTDSFCDSVIQLGSSKILNISKFTDSSTPNATEQTQFIHQYSNYIQERLSLFKKLCVRVLKTNLNGKNLITNLNHDNHSREEEGEKKEAKAAEKPQGIDGIYETILILQAAMDELLKCRFKMSMLLNPLTLKCFIMLLQDSFSLFKCLSDLMLELLEQFFHLDVTTAKKCLLIYKKHVYQTTHLSKMYAFAKRVPQINGKLIPVIHLKSEEMIAAMENYINGGGDKQENIPKANLRDMISENELQMIADTKTDGVASSSMGADMFQIFENAQFPTEEEVNKKSMQSEKMSSFVDFDDDFGVDFGGANKLPSPGPQIPQSTQQQSPSNAPAQQPQNKGKALMDIDDLFGGPAESAKPANNFGQTTPMFPSAPAMNAGYGGYGQSMMSFPNGMFNNPQANQGFQQSNFGKPQMGMPGQMGSQMGNQMGNQMGSQMGMQGPMQGMQGMPMSPMQMQQMQMQQSKMQQFDQFESFQKQQRMAYEQEIEKKLKSDEIKNEKPKPASNSDPFSNLNPFDDL